MTAKDLMIKLSLADPDAEILVDDGTEQRLVVNQAIEMKILEQGVQSTVMLQVEVTK